MGFKSSSLLLALIIFVVSLVGCSRESSIKENVNLKNNHSVVFAFNHPIENPEAFADSIANMSNPDSVLVYDTLTVTVNDTVYFMGFLRYNSDKIYKYMWHFEHPHAAKDTTKKKCEFYFAGSSKGECSFVNEDSHNGEQHRHVFPDTGVYSPIFVAIDGNNARDTAGIGQYIRVIDTPPVLGVPKDTLWTRHKSPVTFPILALDSFGVIKNLLIDLDASGKDSAKVWKFERMEKFNDSLIVTIAFDSTKVDSVGNQKIYVIVEDDDGNRTKDSVNLHFNQLPKLTILSPDDDSEENIRERVLLLYNATDIDNPADLRYFVHATNPIQKDSAGHVIEVVPQLTEKHEIANNIQTTRFEAVTATGENKLGLNGLIYWDVWVTDGYDTVKAEKVNVQDTLRPRRFLLVDPNKTEGSIMGVAEMEGRTDHSGIIVGAVSLSDSSNIYKAITKKNGEYLISNVPPGGYRIVAVPPHPLTYDSDTASSLITMRKGQDIELKEKLLLEDIVNPVVETNFKATEVNSSSQKVNIITRDVDSGIDSASVKAYFNGVLQKWSVTGEASGTWILDLKDMPDGVDTLKVVVKDVAGNADSLVKIFTVKATSIELRTGGDKTKEMVQTAGTISMSATIKNAVSEIKELTWVVDTTVAGKKSPKTPVVSDVASLSLTRVQFKEQFGFEPAENQFYRIVVKTEAGLASNTIQVGYYGNSPVVYFEKPSDSLKVSIKDGVDIKIVALPNNGDGSDDYTVDIKCGGDDTNCPSGILTGKVSWDWTKKNASDTLRVKELTVTLTNKDGKKSTDKVVVLVSRDAPKLSFVFPENFSNLQKISTSKNASTTSFKVDAFDGLGKLQKITYGCTSMELNADGTPKFSLQSVVNDHVVLDNINKQSIEGVLIELTMPFEATYQYRCGIQVIDDDGETAIDSVDFSVHTFKPYVTLNVKNTYTTINDTMSMRFVALDTMGTIAKKFKRCSYNKNDLLNESQTSGWEEFDVSKSVANVIMPTNPATFYCGIRVVDEDDFIGVDYTTFEVLQAPPRQEDVKAHAVRTPVSINDADTLDASAKDLTSYNGVPLKGYIASYQWGCADRPADVKFSAPKSKNEDYIIKVPSTPNDKYTCILQVTDDDGNVVRDTTYIQVLLDPPTVKVDRKTAIGRVGYNLLLDAEAYDKMGSIVKNEWSCGVPSKIETSWKTTPSLNTTWKIEAMASNYLCVVRVTDDDGNTARDTMKVTISTDSPVITVEKENIVLAQGQGFDLNARKNDGVWLDENVSWFAWQCFDGATKKELEALKKYDFIKNGKSFHESRSGSFTAEGKDIYCVVFAEERNTGITFNDTSFIKILKPENMPKGIITAADTVALWSGDETVDKYFYTSEWGGSKSIMGVIGNADRQRYIWTFHNVKDLAATPIDGNKIFETNGGGDNGSLDTSLAQINKVFIRKQVEDSIKICLDYRDSSVAKGAALPVGFLERHRAPTVCRTVHFAKSWKNLSPTDTVIETTKARTAPALTAIKNNVLVSYLSSATAVSSKLYNGTQWANVPTTGVTAADSIRYVGLANNGTDAYMAVLTKGKLLSVYKSAGGTSSWTSVGSAIADVDTSVSISCSPINGKPLVSYIANDKLPYFSYWNGSSWAKTMIPTVSTTVREIAELKNCRKVNRKQVCDTTWKNTTTYNKAREVQTVFNSSGYLASVYVDVAGTWPAYHSTFKQNGDAFTAPSGTPQKVSDEISFITLASSGATFYLGYHSRSGTAEQGGAYVKRATINNGNLAFDGSSQYKTRITDNTFLQKINIAANGSSVYVAFDGRSNMNTTGLTNVSQVNVFRLDGATWKLYGENELPYFNTTFFNKNGYFLRGYYPSVAVTENGKVYTLMLADSRNGYTGTKNFGPILMQYVADSWKVK